MRMVRGSKASAYCTLQFGTSFVQSLNSILLFVGRLVGCHIVFAVSVGLKGRELQIDAAGNDEMRIDGIVISCYRFDLEFTRLCVASIRFWYPHISVWLLKDRQYGDFSTSEIERYWNVQVLPARQKNLGWGFGKLEVMTELPRRRLLLLDSDTTFAGRVIDRLENFDEDLIVENKDYVAIDEVGDQFFCLDRLPRVDPTFKFPGFGFNTGQIVATTGLITKQDFEGLLDWQTRTVKHPEIFKKGEQGLLNYVVLRKMQRGELTLRREPIMVWPGEVEHANHIQVKDFTTDGPRQQVIHWAGMRWGRMPGELVRSDILLHFEEIYYCRVPFGAWLRQWRRARFRVQRGFLTPLKTRVKRVLSKPA